MARAKTKWCDVCHRRHSVEHDHFTRPQQGDAQVVGASSAPGLGDRYEEEIASRRPLSQAETLMQMQEEYQACARRWGRRCRFIYGAAAKVFGDPKIALSDQEEKDFGMVHADAQQAFGFRGNSKVEAAFDVLAAHGMAMAARSDWIKALLEAKKEEEETEETPPVSKVN